MPLRARHLAVRPGSVLSSALGGHPRSSHLPPATRSGASDHPCLGRKALPCRCGQGRSRSGLAVIYQLHSVTIVLGVNCSHEIAPEPVIILA